MQLLNYPLVQGTPPPNRCSFSLFVRNQYTGLDPGRDRGTFREWTDRYQGFRQFIFKSFANRIILMSNLLDSIHFKSIRGRIAEYLIQHSQDSGDRLNITHDILSVELGTAREVISRSLNQLEKEGLIKLSRGQIALISREGIEQYLEL